MKKQYTIFIIGILLMSMMGAAQQSSENIEIQVAFATVSGTGIAVDFTGYKLTAQGSNEFRRFGGQRIKEVAIKTGESPEIYIKPKNANNYVLIADTDPATENVDLLNEDLGLFINNAPYQLGVYTVQTYVDNILNQYNPEAAGQLEDESIDISSDNAFLLFTVSDQNDIIEWGESLGSLLFLKDDANDPIVLLQDSEVNLIDIGQPETLDFRPALLAEDVIVADSAEEQALLETATQQQVASAGGQVESTLTGLSNATPCLNNDDSSANEFETASHAADLQGSIIADFCAGDILYEAGCTDGAVTLEQYSCPSGCENGACETPTAQAQYCLDTDQLSGDDLLSASISSALFEGILATRGATAGFYATENGRQFGIWTDYCVDSNKLVEYYCKGENARFIEVVCPGACNDGKCSAKPLCIDSDGSNPKTRGQTTALSSNGIFIRDTDVCDPATALTESTFSAVIEQTCNRALNLSEDPNTPCESNEVCQNGRCLPSSEASSVECSEDLDCNAGEICDENGECIASSAANATNQTAPSTGACAQDQDCPSGQVCEDSNCWVPCSLDTDCDVAKKCHNGLCGTVLITESNLDSQLDRRLAYVAFLEQKIREVMQAHNAPAAEFCDSDNACDLGETYAACGGTASGCQPATSEVQVGQQIPQSGFINRIATFFRGEQQTIQQVQLSTTGGTKTSGTTSGQRTTSATAQRPSFFTPVLRLFGK
ncbi:hypothetical protein HY501_00305 [Candidatus Woesearchaeota archaeon]|nr:hypothetical protein [Candidatus Woesearchaeota archaeon]